MKFARLIIVAATEMAGADLASAQLAKHSGHYDPISTNLPNITVLSPTNADTPSLPVLKDNTFSVEHPPKPGAYVTQPYTMEVIVPGADSTADKMDMAPPEVPEIPTDKPELKIEPEEKPPQ